jgi:hypothetical protein
MTEQRREFGKRKPLTPPTTPPVKRSGHVALLLMGSLAVGGTGYAMMSHRSCGPADPAVPHSNANCTGGSSGGGGSSGAHFFGGSGSSGASSTAGAESSGGVARGGFGASGHGFGAGGGE